MSRSCQKVRPSAWFQDACELLACWLGPEPMKRLAGYDKICASVRKCGLFRGARHHAKRREARQELFAGLPHLGFGSTPITGLPSSSKICASRPVPQPTSAMKCSGLRPQAYGVLRTRPVNSGDGT